MRYKQKYLSFLQKLLILLNMKKILSFFLIGCFLIVSLVMAGFDRVGIQSVNATIGISPHYTIHRVGYVYDDGVGANVQQSLFETTGINRDVADELLKILRAVSGNNLNATRDASHFSEWARGEPDELVPTAETVNITIMVEGVPTPTPFPLYQFLSGSVYLQLFEQIGTAPGNLNPFPASEADIISQFTSRMWQVVYMRDGVVTLWMTEPYRASQFGGTQGTIVQYADSLLRPNLLNDFTGNTDGDLSGVVGGVLGYFPAAVSTIVPMDEIEWQDQDNQPIVFGGSLAEARPFNNPQTQDMIWIPSHYEVARQTGCTARWGQRSGGLLINCNRHGLWQMSGFDRSFMNHVGWTVAGVTDAWLRSGSTSGANVASSIWHGTGNASGNGSGWPQSFGIRPAIHIDIASLLETPLEAPVVTVTRPAANQLIASWNGIQDAVSYRIRVNNSGAWQTQTATTFVHTITTTGTTTFEVQAISAGHNQIYSTITSESFTVNQEQLVAPSNLEISSAGVLTWDSTNSLGTYIVYRNNTAYSTELNATSWTIPTTWPSGTWNLQVRATAPSSHTWFTNSNLSTGTTHQTWTVTRVIQGVQTPNTVVDGKQFTQPNNPTPPAGHHFVHWALGSLTGAEFDFTTPITNDIYLYAVFAKNTHIVTLVINGVDFPQAPIDWGTNFARPPDPTPPSGYQFQWWALGSSDGSFHFFDNTITSDIRLYAVFSLLTNHVLTLMVNGVPQNLPPTNIVNLSVFAPTPPVGYIFSGWAKTEGGEVVHTPYQGSITLTGDLTLFAVFTPHVDYGSADGPSLILIVGAVLLGFLVIGGITIFFVLRRRKSV